MVLDADERAGQGRLPASGLPDEADDLPGTQRQIDPDPPESGPRVRLFVMGVDKWVDEEDWPLPGTRYTDYYLSGQGPANTAGGGGTLAASPSVVGRDIFESDPRRPVPTVGGTTLAVGGYCGPADQRVVESREDVLCYSTEPLTAPVEVIGHVAMTVFVASSGRDTDIAGKLVDVHPDGRAILLCEGILRCRYRESLARAELLEPDRVYELNVDLGVVANVFLPGHRIRLEIAGSNFPRCDRNTNTGGPIAAETLADAVIVTNVVHHGPSAPSRLTLPVLSRHG